MAKNKTSGVVWLILAVIIAALWWWMHQQALAVQNSAAAALNPGLAYTNAQFAAQEIGVATAPIVSTLQAPLGD